MPDFYIGLFITLGILLYNALAILVVSPWLNNDTRANSKNKKTPTYAIGEHVFIEPDMISRQLQKGKESTSVIAPPPLFWELGAVTFLEMLYAVLLIPFPEILGFTLFTKAISQPFYFRIYSAFILAIDFIYLYLAWHFYQHYAPGDTRANPTIFNSPLQTTVYDKSNGNILQKQFAKLLQIYIIDLIKTLAYGLSFLFAHLFLIFEGVISSSYANVGTANIPTVWFMLSTVLVFLLMAAHGKKAWMQHRYLTKLLPLS